MLASGRSVWPGHRGSCSSAQDMPLTTLTAGARGSAPVPGKGGLSLGTDPHSKGLHELPSREAPGHGKGTGVREQQQPKVLTQAKCLHSCGTVESLLFVCKT